MADEENNEPSNIEEVIRSFHSDAVTEFGEAAGKYDDFMDEDNQANIYNTIFHPGIETLYKTFIENLNENLSDDDKLSSDNKKHAEDALRKGLEAYMEKVNPEVIKAMKEIGVDDNKAKLDYLVNHFEKTHRNPEDPREGINLRGLLEGAVKQGISVGRLKYQFGQNTEKFKSAGMAHLSREAEKHYISKFDSHHVALYNKDKLEDKGLQIKDPNTYFTANMGEQFQLYRHLKKGDPLRAGYEPLGLEEASE